MIPNIGGRSVADDLAVVQQQNSVCNRKGFIMIMRDVNSGDFCLMQNVAQFIE